MTQNALQRTWLGHELMLLRTFNSSDLKIESQACKKDTLALFLMDTDFEVVRFGPSAGRIL